MRYAIIALFGHHLGLELLRKVKIQMLTGAYTQEQNRTFRTTHIEWPYQERPNAKAWKLWTKALLTTTCTETGHLIQPMGQWNENIDKGWKYYLSPKDNYLYSRHDEGWRRHNPIRIGLITKFMKDDFPTKVPETPYPVIPTINRNNIICHHSLSSRRSPNQESTTAGSFSEYIQSHTEPWEQHLVDHLVEKTESEISLSEHVKLGSDLFIVTDGGDTDGSGYFGWVIASNTHTHYMKARAYHQETKNKMNHSALKALAFSQSCDSSYTTKCTTKCNSKTAGKSITVIIQA
eukprot:scaffold17083_cov79-Attheya_sp.AAC.1